MTPELKTDTKDGTVQVTVNVAAIVEMKGAIGSIANWFNLVRPTPKPADFRVQLGVHLEEVREMFDEIELEHYADVQDWDEVNRLLKKLSEGLKKGEVNIKTLNPVGLADALGDQVVTATGVGTFAGMDMVGVLMAIDASNYSKFGLDGIPKFDVNGKVTKDLSTFRRPFLDPYVTDVTEVRWKV